MSDIQKSILSILNERTVRRHLSLLVCVIAAAAVLAVFWALHLNGITMTSGDLICEMEEHEHTSDCYDWVEVSTEETEATETEKSEGSEVTETEEPEGSEAAETENSEATKTEDSEAAETEDSEATEKEESEATEANEQGSTEAAGSGTTGAAEAAVTSESENNTASASDNTENTENTETPQPGDTKVVDGVTYVYSLICGKEEHTHTDACYADDSEDSETEDLTDTEETSASAIEVDGASVTSAVMSYALGNSLTTGSEDPSDYNLAYTVDGMPESGSYILYTYDENEDTYYVLGTDGKLIECEEIASIKYATGDGPYYVTSTGVIVYGADATSAYSAAQWTVTQDDSDSTAYTIAYTDGSSNTTYLAPTGTADDLTIETAFSARTGYVTLSGDFELTYTFKNVGDTEGTNETWNNYIVEINNNQGVYIDVRSDNDGWLAYQTDGASLTFGDGLSDWTAWLSTMKAGTDCTVTIKRSGNTFNFTCVAAGETFTAYVTATDFDGCVANVYLTGEYCEIKNVKYYLNNTPTDQTSGSDTETCKYGKIYPSTVVSAYSSTVTLSAATTASDDSGKTGVEIAHSMLTSTLTESSGTVAWSASGTAATFYLARTVTTTSDEYYFSEAITLADAEKGCQENTYLVYTQINGIYYLVSAADGSLLACTDLATGTNYSDAQKALLSEEAGVYIWELDSSNNNEPVFKFTSQTGSSTADFADYIWELTDTGTDTNATTGTGSYTIYNDENGKYLSAGLYSESIASSGSSGSEVSSAVGISGYGSMTFSITEMTSSNSSYYVQIIITDASNASRFVRIRALADANSNDGLVTLNNDGTISGGTSSGTMYLNPNRTDGVVNTLTITVTISYNQLVVTYVNTDNVSMTYTVTGYDFSSGASVAFWTSRGSFKITPTSSNISSYVRTSLNSDAVTLTAVESANSSTAAAAASYYWTAASMANSTDFSLIAQRETASNENYEIDWVTGTVSADAAATGTAVANVAKESMTKLASTEYLTTTFSLARVKNNYVWFDGTSGGMDSYMSNSSAEEYNEVATTTYDAYGNLNSTITTPTASEVEDASGYGTTTNGGYTLRGWYDIYNNNYYKPGETLSISSNTVMYADWKVESYNIGVNDTTVNSVSTNHFITTRLYDYNELFNTQSTLLGDSVTRSTDSGGVTYYSTDYRTLTLSGHRDIFKFSETGAASMLLGADSSLGFLFFRTETYPYYYTELSKTVNGYDPLVDYPDGRNTFNSSQDEASQGILGDYGTLSTAASAARLLTPLYATDNTVTDVTDPNTQSYVLGKTYVGTADYLFQYDAETGYYYYDSALNAASYNASAGRFYVYDYTIKVSSGSSENDFLPFNYATAGSTVAANDANYWFGMTTEIEFYLPDDVPDKSTDDDYGKVNLAIDNKHHMTFKFSGDDDVWVFIDDVLVLDLGGVHGKVYGEIDFSTGEVLVVNEVTSSTITYNIWDGTTNSVGVIDYTSSATTVPQTNANTYVKKLESGAHTLTFYYLEQGAGQSNAAVFTNISTTTYNLDLTKVDEKNNSTELSGAEFTFYTDSAFTTLASLEKEDGTSASTFTMPGEVACGLVEGKTYYVVETKAPDGYTSAGKYFTVLLKNNVLTITVYDTASTDALETYTYNVTTSTDPSSGETIYSLVQAGSSTSGSLDWNYILYNSASLTATTVSGLLQYYTIKFTVANTTGYEIPSAGSTGIYTGIAVGIRLILIAAAGLLIKAFYQIVWERRLLAIVHKRELTEDKTSRRNIRTGTRGHPRERSVLHGHARDRPGKS